MLVAIRIKMRFTLFILIFISGLFNQINGQVNYQLIDSIKNATIYTDFDTLKTYLVILENFEDKEFEVSGYGNYKTDIGFNKSLTKLNYKKKKTGYYVNNVKINKSRYEYLKKYWLNINECDPCYMIAYDEDDKLVYEAFQYMDCIAGLYIDYFPSGQIKTIGRYKENDTKEWRSWISECYKKEGLWLHYDENGHLIKEERYVDNILQE
jgi:antitoxin component YwqK of YwqJK toxin-antitoxin module